MRLTSCFPQVVGEKGGGEKGGEKGEKPNPKNEKQKKKKIRFSFFFSSFSAMATQTQEESLEDGHSQHKLPAADVSQEMKHLEAFSTEKIRGTWQQQGLPEELSHKAFSDLVKIIVGLEPSNPLVDRLFILADTDKNKTVNFQEFMALLTVLSVGSEEQKLDIMFDLFDLNGDEQISISELSHVIDTLWCYEKALGLIRFGEAERLIYGSDVFAKRLFLECDLDHDGGISRFEYRKMVKKYISFGKPKILDTQTGGHVGAFKISQPGRLTKKTSKAEQAFYTDILSKEQELRRFCPEFFGLSEENEIIMEDLSFRFEKPCVLDLKLGTSSAGEDATGAKLADMRRKDQESTTSSLGVRFTGMRVWKIEHESFVRFNKTWGRALKDDEFTGALDLFLSDQQPRARRSLLTSAIRQLEMILEWMKNQNRLRLFSSSVLFIYDGANPEKELRVKMIDFAHVFPIREPLGRDEGYIFGLANLIPRFQELLFQTPKHEDQ